MKAKEKALSLEGDLTISTALDAKQQVLAALEATNSLTIHLAAVNEIDTAGLQLLILARKEALARGKAVTFKDASQPVSDLVRLAGLAKYLGLAA